MSTTQHPPLKYCSQCGAKVALRTPEGDHLPRYVCISCNLIHYQNPKVVAGCIPEWGDKLLLCRRAIEPRRGYWTLPAGFMENRETTAQAAARESMEEANASLENMSLYALFNLPHISQVYIMFRGELRDGKASPGQESLEVALFAEEEIPWDELAFPVIHETLQLYFVDRRGGYFATHMGDIYRDENQQIKIVRY